ncbi:MAG: RNA 2',3'-cyclic phosphodiesterase [Chloroflexi bacterium]|nr:RNA 2',3'-cyclic phosphodiesterase [Chloroflexota bacterium]
MSQETVRVFVAVELPEELKDKLASIRQELEGHGGEVVRWVDRGSIHLTLKFIGEIPPGAIPEIKSGMEEACKDAVAFPIVTGKIGFFPDAGRPRVFWISLEGNKEALLKLQENVELVMEAIGYQREPRGFSAHLTLARFKDYVEAGKKAMFVQVAERLAVPQCTISVNGISLMRSTLGPNGAKYSRLAFFALRASES